MEEQIIITIDPFKIEHISKTLEMIEGLEAQQNNSDVKVGNQDTHAFKCPEGYEIGFVKNPQNTKNNSEEKEIRIPVDLKEAYEDYKLLIRQYKEDGYKIDSIDDYKLMCLMHDIKERKDRICYNVDWKRNMSPNIGLNLHWGVDKLFERVGFDWVDFLAIDTSKYMSKEEFMKLCDEKYNEKLPIIKNRFRDLSEEKMEEHFGEHVKYTNKSFAVDDIYTLETYKKLPHPSMWEYVYQIKSL